MKIVSVLLIFLLSGEMEADDDIEISYYKGGTVIIEQRPVMRDFCKKMKYGRCPSLADKGLDGRLSVEKSENSDSTTVSIHSLKREDEGKYMFGQQKLELELLPGPSGQNQTQDLSRVGDSVSITCDFDEDPGESGKFLCKGENSLTCNRLYPNNKYYFTENNLNVKKGKKGKKEKKGKKGKKGKKEKKGKKGNNFKVTIKNPQESDAGVYWCGSNFTQESLTYDSLYQAITITGTIHSRETTTTAKTRPLTSRSTSPPDQQTTNVKQSTKSPASAGPLTQPTPTPAPKQTFGTTRTIVVCLALVMMVGGIMLCLFCRYRKKIALSSSSGQDQVAQNAHGSATGTGLSTIYVTAQLPTVPSAAPLYSMLQLPTEPSTPHINPTEPSNPHVYSSIRFHQNPAASNEVVTKEANISDYSIVKAP